MSFPIDELLYFGAFTIEFEDGGIRMWDAEQWSSKRYDYISLGELIDKLQEVRRMIHPGAKDPVTGGGGPDYPY